MMLRVYRFPESLAAGGGCSAHQPSYSPDQINKQKQMKQRETKPLTPARRPFYTGVETFLGHENTLQVFLPEWTKHLDSRDRNCRMEYLVHGQEADMTEIFFLPFSRDMAV